MRELTGLIRALRRDCPGLVLLEEEPLSRHCSFHIGGPCAAMALPSSPAETEAVCRVLRQAGEEPLVMGNGTNLLVTDSPLSRIVLKLGSAMGGVSREGETGLRAGCGATLRQLATAAAAAGLAGLEFAHGIPGSVGGGVSMNAGAYGGELGDVVTRALWLDETLTARESGELAMCYRHSRFSDTGDVILAARFTLTPDDPAAISLRMKELLARRQASQPLELPSAGSTFKRPPEGYAAALIDGAGLRGRAVGGAMVSPKHAGFVVNTGGATFDDVLRLMAVIQEEVLRSSGVSLEPEVKIIRG